LERTSRAQAPAETAAPDRRIDRALLARLLRHPADPPGAEAPVVVVRQAATAGAEPSP
jgi:hypothetical protein